MKHNWVKMQAGPPICARCNKCKNRDCCKQTEECVLEANIADAFEEKGNK